MVLSIKDLSIQELYGADVSAAAAKYLVPECLGESGLCV